jgi:hypothetical protein
MVDDATTRHPSDPFSDLAPIRTNRNRDRGNLPLRESKVAEPELILGGEIRDLSAVPPQLILSVAERRIREQVNGSHHDAGSRPRRRSTNTRVKQLDREMSRDEALHQATTLGGQLYDALDGALKQQPTTPLAQMLKRPTDIKAIGTTWAIVMDKLSVLKALPVERRTAGGGQTRPGVLALARRIAEAQTDLYP